MGPYLSSHFLDFKGQKTTVRNDLDEKETLVHVVGTCGNRPGFKPSSDVT